MTFNEILKALSADDSGNLIFSIPKYWVQGNDIRAIHVIRLPHGNPSPSVISSVRSGEPEISIDVLTIRRNSDILNGNLLSITIILAANIVRKV
jgi:hypothetical protein